MKIFKKVIPFLFFAFFPFYAFSGYYGGATKPHGHTGTGDGGLLNRSLIGDGTEALPSFTFYNDTNTGLYRINPDKIGFSIGGTVRACFLADGTFMVTDSTGDCGIGSGTSAGSIITGTNRFFRSVNAAHTGTIRLLGINSSNNIILGGEPANTPVILNAGTGNVRMDNTSQLTWRNGADSANVRTLDVDSSNNLNVLRDDTAGTVQIFKDITIYDDAATPAVKGTIYAATGNIETAGTLKGLGSYNATTASAANVNIDSTGLLKRSTSSRRYKKNITDYHKGLAELLTLRPVSFESINGNDGKIYAGLIAEEVDAAGFSEFVDYNNDGQPDSVYYANVVAILINAIKDMQKEITDLQASR